MVKALCRGMTPALILCLAALQEAVKAELRKGVTAQASDTLAKAASSALVFAALKKGTLDNVTVVVIMLRWD